MTTFKSILVTTDFSEAAHNAVCRAVLIAAEHKAGLILLNVVDPSSFKALCAWLSAARELETKLAEAKTRLGRIAVAITARHGVRVTPIVRVGDALEQIRSVAEDADLMVIGARKTNALRAFVLGTPAERLLRIFRLPVLVTKPVATGSYLRTLVPVDLTADSHALLRTAAEFAPAAAVHLFHALSVAREMKMRAADVPDAFIESHKEGLRDKALFALRSMIEPLEHRKATVSIGHGDPWLLSLKKQQEISAELIVNRRGRAIGSRRVHARQRGAADTVERELRRTGHSEGVDVPDGHRSHSGRGQRHSRRHELDDTYRPGFSRAIVEGEGQ